MTTNEEDFLNRKKNMCLNSLKNKKYFNSVKRKLNNIAFVINDEKNNRYLFGDKSNHRIKCVSYENGETQDEVTTKFTDSKYENLSIKEQLKILTPKNYKSLYDYEIDHAWCGHDRFYGVSLGKLFTIDDGIESVNSLYKLHGFGDDSTDKFNGLTNAGVYIGNIVYDTENIINTDKLINLYKNTNNLYTTLAINNVNSVGYFDNISKATAPIEMLKATGVRLLLWKEGYKNSCNITMEFCTTSVPKYITATSNNSSTSEYKTNEDHKIFGFPGKLRRGFTSYKNYIENRYANKPSAKVVIGGSYLDAIKIGTAASHFNYISILPTYSNKITKLPYINDLTTLTYDETVAYSESSYAPFDTLVEDM